MADEHRRDPVGRMSDVSPRMADTIRKLVAYSVAGFGTVLLMRVLFRWANGRGALFDPELFIVVALAALMIWWVRAAKPVRRHGTITGRDDKPTSP